MDGIQWNLFRVGEDEIGKGFVVGGIPIKEGETDVWHEAKLPGTDFNFG